MMAGWSGVFQSARGWVWSANPLAHKRLTSVILSNVIHDLDRDVTAPYEPP